VTNNHLQTGDGPLYKRVKSEVIERIVNGAWNPGDRLPSEAALALELGVSQGTVRKAFDELAAENVILRHQGRGTFVSAHTPQRELFHFFHLTDGDGTRQLPKTARVIDVARRRASRDEIEHLDLASGSRVIAIERLRTLKGRPAILEKIVLPAALFPGLGADTRIPNELYQLLETDYSVTIHRAVEHLKATAAAPAIAKHLRLPSGAAILEIDRLAETIDGTSVEWRVSYCDTRFHRYLSEIV